MKRGKYKVVPCSEFSHCRFCGAKTNGILSDFETIYCELWCCESCAWKHGKIKRFAPHRHKSLPNQEKLKISQKSLVDFQGMGVQNATN